MGSQNPIRFAARSMSGTRGAASDRRPSGVCNHAARPKPFSQQVRTADVGAISRGAGGLAERRALGNTGVYAMSGRFKRDKDTPFTLAASAVFLAIMVGALWYAITQGDTTAIFFTLVLVFWLPALSVVGWAAQTEREMTEPVEYCRP